MSHQPFETWIFSDDLLDEVQQQQLEEHLDNCQTCKTLSDAVMMVDNVLPTHEAPLPKPGFTQRWQNRLLLYRQHQQKRKTWLLTMAILILANLILFSLILFDLITINWSYEFGQVIVKISLIATQSRQYWRAISNLTGAFPIIVPLVFISAAGLFSAGVILLITWLRSMNKLIENRMKE